MNTYIVQTKDGKTTKIKAASVSPSNGGVIIYFKDEAGKTIALVSAEALISVVDSKFIE